MKRDSRAGFTLPELAAGIGILVAICSVGFALIRQTSQKTKIVVAKASLSQYSMLMETVKSDVCYYPPDTNNDLESLTSATAPPGYGNNWKGPYLQEMPVDPWKTPYFYRLIFGITFGPVQCQRSTPPKYQDFSFTAIAGDATIILDNFGLTACSVMINGTEVITESEFKKQDVHLEKPITLLAGTNTLSLRARSNKSAYIFLSITSPFSKKASYIIGSYGADKKAGGDGINKDLTWVTGQSGADF